MGGFQVARQRFPEAEPFYDMRAVKMKRFTGIAGCGLAGPAQNRFAEIEKRLDARLGVCGTPPISPKEGEMDGARDLFEKPLRPC
jgi:hypothetical protein